MRNTFSFSQEEKQPDSFKAILASYGYRDHHVVLSKEAAESMAAQAPGKIIDNKTGLGAPKQWRIVRAEIEPHNEHQGVVMVYCEAVNTDIRIADGPILIVRSEQCHKQIRKPKSH